MKVLLVVHQYLPRHVTGTEQYVRTVAAGLRAKGVDARIFAYEPLVEEEASGEVVLVRDEVVEDVPVHRVGLHEDLMASHLRDYENPLVETLLGRHLDEHAYDVVHIFHLRHIGTGGILQPKSRGIPVVVHLMDFWFICANYLLWHRDGNLCDGPPEEGFGCIRCMDPPLAKRLERRGLSDAVRTVGDVATPAGSQDFTDLRRAHSFVHRKERLFAVLDRADLLVAPSLFLQSIFAKEGVDVQRILHIPYGLDRSRFAKMPARKADPGKSRLDIGYIGSISRHKGVSVLLDAMQLIEGDGLHLHVYGRRASQPGYSEKLIDECDDPRVTFHGKFHPQELGRVLAELDALVVPSLWYENTPFSVLEALHVELPVLASDLGGISEIVRQGRNGRLFPAGDAAAIARILEEIMADPVGQLRVKGTAQASVDDNVERFLELYEQMILAGSPR